MFGLKRLTKEIKNMSSVLEKLAAETAKIAEKNFGDDTNQINSAVAEAIAPVTERVTALENAVLSALEAMNNDDPVVDTKAEVEGILKGAVKEHFPKEAEPAPEIAEEEQGNDQVSGDTQPEDTASEEDKSLDGTY